jgi:hypothetical protein
MASPADYPWTLHFVWKLLHNDRGTLSLLANNPFPDAPPHYIRARLYRYQFAPIGEKAWWKRERIGEWLPALDANDPRFRRLLEGWTGWIEDRKPDLRGMVVDLNRELENTGNIQLRYSHALATADLGRAELLHPIDGCMHRSKATMCWPRQRSANLDQAWNFFALTPRSCSRLAVSRRFWRSCSLPARRHSAVATSSVAS